jgi:C4-dicarboxylate-specific signal transduction histidine kinase
LSDIIICVDDEKIILDALYSELKANLFEDFDIELAQSGEEALEIIEECIEDNINIPLIISDFIMPGMKGDEFLIQAHKIIPNTNKIMLTGQSSMEGITNAINYANLYRFMSKPWDSSNFMLTINGAIKDFKQREKIESYKKDLELKVQTKTKELKQLNESLEQRIKEELEKNRIKEQLLAQQAKTSVMGEMLAAIIHQWKQPLAAINAVNDETKFKSKFNKLTPELVELNCEAISQQVEHMKNTMDDFRNFFKPAIKKEYHVNDVLLNTNHLIGDILKSKGIDLKINSDIDQKTIGFDNELIQVIINIVNNARDAIEENNSENKTIFVNSKKDNNFIEITIQDCAGGIPEDIIKKIFDPYFTTKPDDKGTGIGLDMSKSIIQKVNGSISVENRLVKIADKEYNGACFIIRLKGV